jgi:bifunctional DNA primase/polymerase-like protein/primase-like protein
MKTAVSRLAERGMAVFPVKPNKHPLTQHGCLDGTKDQAFTNSWWTKWPTANIAIATGKPSGIFVLDVDPDKGGEVELQKLEKEHGELPPTVEVITGRGGRHLYFLRPTFEGAPVIRNSESKVGDGLNIRGEGGYVVAPPSVHENGRTYAWSVDTATAFAEAPLWLLEVIVSATRKVIDLNGRRPNSYWRDLLRGVPEGKRNRSAASLAGLLIRKLDPALSLELLLCWNERNDPPEEEDTIIKVFNSIFEREMLRRRSIG